MSPTLKRVLLSAALLVVAAVIGFGIYYLFYKKTPLGQFFAPAPSPAAPTEVVAPLPTAGVRVPAVPGAAVSPGAPAQPAVTALPPAPQPAYTPRSPLTKIVAEATAFQSLNPTANAMRYHNPADGKFYRVLTDGSIQPLSAQVFYNVRNVTWASRQNKAIIEYPDNSKILYDFDRQKQTASLPKHWQEFSFSPEGSQIAAKSIGLSPENRWLITFSDDATETKLIEPMGKNADKVQVSWSPNRQVVAFSQTGEPLGFDRRDILLIGLHHENFKSLTVEGRDFTPQWSPSGQRLLYSVYSMRTNLKPELWLTTTANDKIDDNRQMLKINTWADKCAFADDNVLFCAVPRSLPEGAGISRGVADNIPDDLYKIDLQSGLKIPIPLGADEHTFRAISCDSAAGKIFFTDINQSGIFEVKI